MKLRFLIIKINSNNLFKKLRISKKKLKLLQIKLIKVYLSANFYPKIEIIPKKSQAFITIKDGSGCSFLGHAQVLNKTILKLSKIVILQQPNI